MFMITRLDYHNALCAPVYCYTKNAAAGFFNIHTKAQAHLVVFSCITPTYFNIYLKKKVDLLVYPLYDLAPSFGAARPFSSLRPSAPKSTHDEAYAQHTVLVQSK